ncbi:hypothetical protein ACSSS7_000425 [Eimeria intestinalis]
MHVAPVDVGWRGDVAITYPDPDEAVLDPCGEASVAYPLYSIDSGLSSEESDLGWACNLPPCVPPLGLVSVSLGLQLGSGLLLYAVATNGQRLHGIEASLTDPELPFIHISFIERSPKTYAWCMAYVLSALLVGSSLLAAGAAAVAIFLACIRWARVVRCLGILHACICFLTALICGAWVSGYAVSQSGLSGASITAFLKPFNYGTLLFVKNHQHMLRAAGTMSAAAAAAAARLTKATCHDTAAAATLSGYGLVVSWGVCFLLMQGALGGMAPPIFGVPSFLVCFILLAYLNFDCCEGRRDILGLLLFSLSFFIACIAWAASHDMYSINYSNRNPKETFLTQQLRRLVDIRQWGRALGDGLGVAALICLAATQAILSLFTALLLFYRAFGWRIEQCKRKRRQKRQQMVMRHPGCGAIRQQQQQEGQQQEEQKQQQQQQTGEQENITKSEDSNDNSLKQQYRQQQQQQQDQLLLLADLPFPLLNVLLYDGHMPYRLGGGGGRRPTAVVGGAVAALGSKWQEPQVNRLLHNIQQQQQQQHAAAIAAIAAAAIGAAAAIRAASAIAAAASNNNSSSISSSNKRRTPMHACCDFPSRQTEGLATFWWTEERHLEEEEHLSYQDTNYSTPNEQEQQQQQQQQQQEEEEESEKQQPQQEHGQQRQPQEELQPREEPPQPQEQQPQYQQPQYQQQQEQQKQHQEQQPEEGHREGELFTPMDQQEEEPLEEGGTTPGGPQASGGNTAAGGGGGAAAAAAESLKDLLGEQQQQQQQQAEAETEAQGAIETKEDLVDKVIQRWQEANYKPFRVEHMAVSSEEQQRMLRLDAITPNLVNIYMRSLEIVKTPLTSSKHVQFKPHTYAPFFNGTPSLTVATPTATTAATAATAAIAATAATTAATAAAIPTATATAAAAAIATAASVGAL